jgi:hypothetical protein
VRALARTYLTKKGPALAAEGLGFWKETAGPSTTLRFGPAGTQFPYEVVMRGLKPVPFKIIGCEGQHKAPEQDVDGVGKAQPGYEAEGLSGQAGCGCPVG